MSKEQCYCCCCWDRTLKLNGSGTVTLGSGELVVNKEDLPKYHTGGLYIQGKDEKETPSNDDEVVLTGGDGNKNGIYFHPDTRRRIGKAMKEVSIGEEIDMTNKEEHPAENIVLGKTEIHAEPRKFIIHVETGLRMVTVHVLDLTDTKPKKLQITLQQDDKLRDSAKSLVDIVSIYQPISMFFEQGDAGKTVEDAFRQELEKPYIAMEIDDKNFMTYRF